MVAILAVCLIAYSALLVAFRWISQPREISVLGGISLIFALLFIVPLAMLLHHGFCVLMLDARAHRASGGALATYGQLERDDMRRGSNGQRYNRTPHAYSDLASRWAPQLLQAVKAEPSSVLWPGKHFLRVMREIAYDRVGQFFHAGPWLGRSVFRPVVEIAFWYARWKYHLDLEHVVPDEAVAWSQVPVWLIHGRDDRNIPVRHSRQIARDNRGLTVWEVPGADQRGSTGA